MQREAAVMRISTSKCKTVVLSQKRVGCFLRVGSEVLSQVEELKCLRVLFSSEQGVEWEIDRQISGASAVVQTLYWAVMAKRELSQKATLSVF